MLKVLADTDKSAPLRHLEQVATQPRPFKTAVLLVSLNADMVEPVPYWSAKCNVRVYRCAFNRCQLVGRLERSCESTSKRDLVGKVHVVLHLHDLCYVACCLLRSGRAPGPLHHAPYDQLNAGVVCSWLPIGSALSCHPA